MLRLFGKAPREPMDRADCNGCGLCLLVCPLWRRDRDPRMTPENLVKAAQRGAMTDEFALLIETCPLCGACEPACPNSADIPGLILDLRQRLTHSAVKIADDSPRRRLPGLMRRTPGEALSSKVSVRRKLGTTDLYVIEPRAYHADYERLVGHYDRLRKETGCMLNLDLQRIAIPAVMEAAWILQGRNPARIVVESQDDRAAFERVCDIPVVHVAELAED